jgi:hypothetical protein
MSRKKNWPRPRPLRVKEVCALRARLTVKIKFDVIAEKGLGHGTYALVQGPLAKAGKHSQVRFRHVSAVLLTVATCLPSR